MEKSAEIYTFVLSSNMPEGPKDPLLCYESLDEGAIPIIEDLVASIEDLAALFDEIRRLTDLLS